MAIGVGTIVTHGDEEWIIDSFVADGGFGQVFHATRSKPFPMEAAVDVPAPHILAHPIWSKKFEREARILANLKHPNVVKVIAFWKFKTGEMALVQEFVKDRKTLSQHVLDPNNDRVSALLQALYGLRAIHGTDEHGVVHRDVAPQNLLVAGDGKVKIIDFGLAKEDPRVTVPLTVTGAWFGTPGCMSPEQCTDSGKVDHRTDLYGLGRTFAAALQQRQPIHVEIHKLPAPWGEICRLLSEHDADDRPADSNTAISIAMRATVAAGIAPQELLLHAKEAENEGMPSDGWPEFCAHYFREAVRLGTLSYDDIRAGAKLASEVFADGAFDADGLFEAIENGPLGQHFSTGGSSFEGVDPYGAYLMESSTPTSRTRTKSNAGAAWCVSAIDYHRYPLMSCSSGRSIATRAARRLCARLIEALVAEDPDGVIEGRGIIPIPKADPISGAA